MNACVCMRGGGGGGACHDVFVCAYVRVCGPTDDLLLIFL